MLGNRFERLAGLFAPLAEKVCAHAQSIAAAPEHG
jgi:hypothetical protein